MLLLRMTMLLLRMTMLLLRMTMRHFFIKPAFSVASKSGKEKANHEIRSNGVINSARVLSGGQNKEGKHISNYFPPLYYWFVFYSFYHLRFLLPGFFACITNDRLVLPCLYCSTLPIVIPAINDKFFNKIVALYFRDLHRPKSCR
jgi:hypothetical protein